MLDQTLCEVARYNIVGIRGKRPSIRGHKEQKSEAVNITMVLIITWCSMLQRTSCETFNHDS